MLSLENCVKNLAPSLYLDFKVDLSGGVALAVVGRAGVAASVLRVNIGNGEGVVRTDTGPTVSTLSTTNTIYSANNIPLDQSLLLARQDPRE